MHRPSKRELSVRRQKLAVRAALAFSVAKGADGVPESITLFRGRRALTRELSPGLLAMLSAALSPAGQSL